MTLDLERICDESASPEAVDQGTSTAKAGPLVINLCKVGAPITIPQPRSPQLARFRFFLSHSRQGNCRKYWLQMGYFSTHVEADRWLKILRGIYPGAVVSAQNQGDEQHGVTALTSERRPGATFRETLEILGTSEFDMGSEAEINGTGVQDLRIELQKESPPIQTFSRSRLRRRKS
jgi:hypothetical protein